MTLPAKGAGFAGLVLTGDDPRNRLQFGWTERALVTSTYRDGNNDYSAEMMTADLPVKPGHDAQLLLEVKDGFFTTRIYDPTYDVWLETSTARLDPDLTRVGLLTYSKAGVPVTASFDRIEIFF